jgi:hypothetical protein
VTRAELDSRAAELGFELPADATDDQARSAVAAIERTHAENGSKPSEPEPELSKEREPELDDDPEPKLGGPDEPELPAGEADESGQNGSTAPDAGEEPGNLVANEETRAVVGPESEQPRLRFLTGREFVDQEIEQRPALLGRAGDVLLPAAGLAIVGGPGGSGKSTLTLHAVAHLASGTPWLGIEAARPLRVGIIENEGPKAPFIDKVKAFAEAWVGPEFLERCSFLDSPWGRFSLADEGLRAELRSFALGNELDLLVAGPLGRLGIEGVGSPEETRRFLELLGEAGCQRDEGGVAFWLLHHVNKGRHPSIVQALSGDWGGHPDLILGVEHTDGERRTKLVFGKVRWGDQGRRPLLLDWLPPEEGIGYRVTEIDASRQAGAANRQRVLELVQTGTRSPKAIAAATDLTKKTVIEHLKALAEEEPPLVRLETGPNRSIEAVPSEAADVPLELDGLEEGVNTEDLEWY